MCTVATTTTMSPTAAIITTAAPGLATPVAAHASLGGLICFIGMGPRSHWGGALGLLLHKETLRHSRFGPVLVTATLRGFVHIVRVDMAIMLVKRPFVVGHLFPTPWAWLLQGWAFRVLIFSIFALPFLAIGRSLLMLDQCVRVPSDITPADSAVLAWVFV